MNIQNQIEVEVKQTEKQYFERFVALYHEQNTIAEDIKALTDEVKEKHPEADVSNLKAVAKLKSEQKVGDKVSSVNKLIEAIDTYTK